MLIGNILSLALFLISLGLALRTIFLSFRTNETDHRLFILGLSLGIFSLTSLANYLEQSRPEFLLNVQWFFYIGQVVCFLCIVLSQATSRRRDLRSLIRWEIAFFVLLLVLLTPILPASLPYPGISKIILSGLCAFFCLLIFFFYLAALIRRGDLFSVLTGGAFCLLSFGYILSMPYQMQGQYLFLSTLGDGVRVCGLLLLLSALVFTKTWTQGARVGRA